MGLGCLSNIRGEHMPRIVMKERHDGGYEYSTCSECRHVQTIKKPSHVKLPYCGECGKAVEDQEQKYCGWCGCQFEE